MMYYPLIETDPNCVPYLSGSYIDSFCQDLVRRFDPDVIEKGHPLNIERFITDYLGLNLEVENLSCDLSILGATVFSDTDEFPVYDVRLNEAVYRSAKEGTVFVENELRRRGLSNRYRFTLAHEAGHAIVTVCVNIFTSLAKARRGKRLVIQRRLFPFQIIAPSKDLAHISFQIIWEHNLPKPAAIRKCRVVYVGDPIRNCY